MGLSELQAEIDKIISRFERPEKAVVTGGMPYANGQLHVGHIAGAFVPPDVYARWLKMFIGADQVVFVSGTDDHGSTSELSAKKSGTSVPEFISQIHAQQNETLKRYNIDLTVYTGTSREELFEDHKNYCQEFIRKLYHNGFLEKRTTQQWYDSALQIFLPDRYVQGICPKCDAPRAYSDQCDTCGAHYAPEELKEPVSTVSGETPSLKETDHWWLDMWRVADQLNTWIATKQRTWRKQVYTEASGEVAPCIVFPNTHEPTFKAHRDALPKHKSRYAPGKRIIVQFENKSDLEAGKALLVEQGVPAEIDHCWAYRSITRDISWGIPVPEDLDPAMNGKTFYVWPESLIAPISFTRFALKKQGIDPERYKEFWHNPKARIAQFIGVDNVFFYVVMQGALWFGSQKDPKSMPTSEDLQLTDVYANCHLQINGEKMSKSTGNFYTANELLDTYGFSPDHLRYYLSQLSLPKKQSNFDLEQLKEKVDFLANPMNAAFERTLSAAHSKFDSKVPAGALIGKTEAETRKVIQLYMKNMDRAEYPDLLFIIENYARLINKLFATYKPHDDRHPEESRRDALFSSFFILKNLLIMLYPFVPTTMERLRESLRLPATVYAIDELGKPIAEGHEVGPVQTYFEPVPGHDAGQSQENAS
jgi:methionyl-tRNA synthetase